ncbi:MAG: glycosyltransferase family 9 protein [Candidatus Omnitrophica bacterium]|nr:glycosyltransferase family 9 protein [Candidatus Omnitrophota bacterium]MBU4589906.1 glycosyltransferase family 9 protein [Candidatus Omnitrophota bacterium]
MKEKILIVKLGFTETIDKMVSTDNVSLGDVFRTTVILHLFKHDNVTWLTTKEALPLLKGNPFIQRLLVYDLTSASQLQAEPFDVVINLEKVPGVCALTDSIHAWRRYGFRFDAEKGTAEAYEHSYDAVANSEDPILRKNMKKHWIEMLYAMVDKKWQGEEYVLGYKPKTREKFDIGFNVKVGKRWPNKAWPGENWKELERLTGRRFSITHQQSLDNIEGYIDWLNSSRLIVTNDSLGLHLALALGKKVVAMFGPTSEKEVFLFNRGVIIRPSKKLKCMPCFNTVCKYGKSCMHYIKPETIYKHIAKLLKRGEHG